EPPRRPRLDLLEGAVVAGGGERREDRRVEAASRRSPRAEREPQRLAEAHVDGDPGSGARVQSREVARRVEARERPLARLDLAHGGAQEVCVVACAGPSVPGWTTRMRFPLTVFTTAVCGAACGSGAGGRYDQASTATIASIAQTESTTTQTRCISLPPPRSSAPASASAPRAPAAQPRRAARGRSRGSQRRR